LKNYKIGFGTAAIGRPQYINIRQEVVEDVSIEAFREQGIKVLDEAYERGVRYYDTAPNYGLAEQLLIDWVTDKEDPNIEVATKWGYTYEANFDANATLHETKEHSLNRLKKQWIQSIKLLPYLSTYQIHSATLDSGVLDNESILSYLVQLKDQHQIRIGITTSGANQAEVLLKALDVEINGALLFDVFQVTYNVFDQSIGPVAERITNQNGRLVIKEAMANGRIFLNDQYPDYTSMYSVLEHLAAKYEVGVDAIALRFCIDSIPLFKVLSGAATEQHLIDNLKAERFKLSLDDVEQIKRLTVDPASYWTERKKLKWN
jgi:aryl-alcohol dehydrogenase-like predicted oxidoreductase